MVIDMHTHISLPPTGAGSADMEPLLKMLADNHVDKVVVMPTAGLYSNCLDHRADNDSVFEFCKRAPEQLLPAFAVNPLFGQKAIDEIRRCTNDLGMNLLKLHPWVQGFSVTSKQMDAVAETCQELGTAVFFHDGTPPYCTPLQLARLCRDFPDLRVVSGHAGLNDLWFDSLSAAKRYANYFVCLCGVTISQMQRIVDEVSPHQICVGSDTSGMMEDLLWYRWEQWRRVKVSDEAREIIENQTPRKLLGEYV